MWFTLFAAGVAVAGDLVALLYTFLQGEVTIRFILKVLAVLVVAGGIFSYYYYDLRRPSDASPNRLLVSLAGLLIIASIICGFVTFGSPATQRATRLDNQRASDLGNIQWQVLNHWQANETLPTTLEDLKDEFGGYYVPVDPETKTAYEYTVTGPLTFELCATFERPSDAELMNPSMTRPVDYGFDSRFPHEAGRTCYTRTIDPEKYPPFPDR